jgi:hypothetical protein
MLKELDANDKQVDSVKLDRACSAVATNCGGFVDGQRFDSMAGRADAQCNGSMNGGPPDML